MGRRRVKNKLRSWLPLGVLALGVLLTTAATYALHRSARTESRRDFEVEALEAREKLERRLETYITLLRGGRGLFAVEPDVSREEWAKYVERLRIQETYPGVQGIGFTVRIPAAELGAWTERMRNEGFPDFSVKPAQPRGEYHAIVFLEPLDRRNRAAIGYDMFTEPTRRAAMQRAWATGLPAASGRVELVQEIEGPVQSGFLIYVPVYKNGATPEAPRERHEQLIGFVYCPFRSGDLMEATFAASKSRLEVSIYDGEEPSSTNLLHRTGKPISGREAQTLTMPLDVGGRRWTLVFTAHALTPITSGLLAILPITGFAVTGLLSYFAQREGRARIKAEQTAAELEEQRERLHAASRALQQRVEQLAASESALMAARSELAEYAATLEKKVAERTARLTETVGELEAFSYSVTHDLRAPLRAMNAFTQALIEDHAEKLGEEGRDYLERINSASRRMDQLITDVLAYSRVARTQLKLEPIDVDRLAREIIPQYPVLQPPQAEVRVESPLMPVIGEQASLTQALSNLMINAVKFVQPGQLARVVVRTEQRGEEVRVWVEDNGIGIHPKDQERIFGMFERIHSQSAYEGTGIGLAIVKKAVQRMGGTVGLESELGKGSRFWIQLPKGDQ